MRLVPIGSLKVGTVVGKSIYNETGHILLKEGVDLTSSLIEKLQNNGIRSIYIQDNYSLEVIEDVISPQLRSQAVKEVKAVFDMVQRELTHKIDDMRKMNHSLKRRLSLIADQKYYQSIADIIEEMMIALSHNKDAMVGLVDIKNMNGALYQHAVQVTVLSLVLGVELKMSPTDLRDLAISAMLHDIGLSLIDSKLWIYKESFTEEETEIYRSHPTGGYHFIKETSNLSPKATIGILEHHECYNGSGFPLGIKGEKIHINGRIIALANVFDKMTSGMDGHVVPVSEAIEYLMANAGDTGFYDLELTRHFVRRIIAYPDGCHVRLSNGLTAVILANNFNHPMRPIVGIIDPSHQEQAFALKKLDLLSPQNYNLTIVETIYE